MENKREKLITPVGEAKWAHLHTPKAAFKDQKGNTKGDPKYQIDLVFDATNPEWKAWASAVMEKIRLLPDQVNKSTGQPIPKQAPIKKELDENDQPTGRFYVTFKTGARFKPGVFDRYGKPIPETVLIGNGSKVRVNYTPNEYREFGGGINFYLNAAQVVELVEFKPSTAQAFGFAVENEVIADPFDAAKKEESDDLPF